MVSSQTTLDVETLDHRPPTDAAPEPDEDGRTEGGPEDGSGDGPDSPSTAPTAKRRPRRVRALALDDWLSLGGSVLASFALVEVGYLHLVDFSGLVGFALCWYVVFLLVYGTVVSIANPRHIVIERLVAATLYLVAALVIFALATTVVYTFVKGWRAFVHPNFFTHDMAGVAPSAPLNQGGILHAIVGTVIEVGIAVVVAVPLGIGTAVYMTEVKGPGSHLIRTVVEAMTALSDILAGLFVYALLVVGFGLGKTGLAAAVAIAVTMLPLVARASEVALRVVPGGLREASAALGATHWKTTWKVVLPSAQAGLVTAAILAIARGIGETAVVLVTSGASSFLTFNPTGEPMNSLPLYIYTAYQTHDPVALTRAFGAASVLLAMVLMLFVVARWIVRDKTGRERNRTLVVRSLFVRDRPDTETAP
jgi:phosphate transport system permease protein